MATNIKNILQHTIADISKPITSKTLSPENGDFATFLSEVEKGNSGKDGTDLACKKTAQEFLRETGAVLWNTIFEQVEVDPLFGGGIGEEILRSELVHHMVQDAYASPKTKLFKDIEKSLKRKEELNDRESTKEGIREKPS